MGMTLRQFVDGPLRWNLFECGRQGLWNQINQIINSEAGSGITAGTTILGTLDITAGTGIQRDSTPSPKTLSGTFGPGAESSVSGFTVPPADPSGNVGPHPQRITQRVPIAGFRPSV